MTSRDALRERLRAAFRVDDPPWRVAAALAVGVFVSCTPLYGFQTLLSLLVATVFRLNKAAVVGLTTYLVALGVLRRRHARGMMGP